MSRKKESRGNTGETAKGRFQFRNPGLTDPGLLSTKPPGAQGHFESWGHTCQFLGRHRSGPLSPYSAVGSTVLKLYPQRQINRQHQTSSASFKKRYLECGLRQIPQAWQVTVPQSWSSYWQWQLQSSEPEEPIHDCPQTIDVLHAARPDLTDVPLQNPEEVLYTDGSSFMVDGVRYTGAAVVTLERVTWAQALPHGTSAQKAELIALIKALDWAEGKSVNIYTDSRYAFAMAHVHGAIYKERGLLTSERKIIKNEEEILALIEAIWKPKAVALIHCKGHQKGDSPEAKGNRAADLQARQAALGPVKPLTLLVTLLAPNLPPTPMYLPEEENFAKERGMAKFHRMVGSTRHKDCAPRGSKMDSS
ncbi:uncharacterized protein LOC144577126 [Callithrix jacchus]